MLDNLTRVVAPGRNHYYCYDGYWQLTNVKTTSCSGTTVIGLGYEDPAGYNSGNLTNKNGTAYTFDYGNRLRSSGGNGVPTTTYVYDGHGRRVRDLTGESRYSFYTQGGQLGFASDYRANKFTNYIYLGGSLVATREWPHGGGAFTAKYQHTDALGSPVVVTDASRNIVERNEYEPYGKTLDATEDEVGYTGHVTDAATGLVYAQQRYYDPMIGRFLSVDPVTADGATGANFNRYWYGNNNPYRFTDPDGRAPQYFNVNANDVANARAAEAVQAAEAVVMPKSVIIPGNGPTATGGNGLLGGTASTISVAGVVGTEGSGLVWSGPSASVDTIFGSATADLDSIRPSNDVALGGSAEAGGFTVGISSYSSPGAFATPQATSTLTTPFVTLTSSTDGAGGWSLSAGLGSFGLSYTETTNDWKVLISTEQNE